MAGVKIDGGTETFQLPALYCFLSSEVSQLSSYSDPAIEHPYLDLQPVRCV